MPLLTCLAVRWVKALYLWSWRRCVTPEMVTRLPTRWVKGQDGTEGTTPDAVQTLCCRIVAADSERLFPSKSLHSSFDMILLLHAKSCESPACQAPLIQLPEARCPMPERTNHPCAIEGSWRANNDWKDEMECQNLPQPENSVDNRSQSLPLFGLRMAVHRPASSSRCAGN